MGLDWVYKPKTRVLCWFGVDETNAQRIFGLRVAQGRWLLIAVGFGINVCMGSVYAYSVFRNPIQELFSTSTFESGLPYMTFQVVLAILMFFGGRLIVTIGPAKVGVIGGLLVGGGWILSGLVARVIPSIWTLVAMYGVLGGAGVGLAYGGPLAIATRWFPERKGLAVGLTITGFGASPFVTANLAQPLIAEKGPLTAFLTMGIAFLVIMVVLSSLLRLPQADWQPAVDARTTRVGQATHEIDTATMVRTSTFRGLFAVYVIGCVSGLMAIGISSPVATDVIKLNAATAATLVGVFAIVNGAGRPVFGALTDRITPRWTAVLSMGIILGASLLMLGASAETVPLYIVCFSALWACHGAWLTLAPTATAYFFGPKHYPRNYGVVFFAYGVGAIIANVVSGNSKDLFGSYDVAFAIVAGLAVLGAVVSIRLLKPPRTE